MDSAREIALRSLYKVEKNQAYSNIVLNQEIKNNKYLLSNKDIGFISELVYGVTTWKLTLDEIIKKHSKIKVKKISPWILNILRMGIYQIIFLSKVPKSAAVNESVNLAKKYGNKGSIGFTNAILRKIEVKDFEELFNIKDDTERISKTTSMPKWIVEKLLEQRRIEEVEQICKNSNERPKLTIRVNKLKTNKEELKQILTQNEIEYAETEMEDFLILKNLKNIEEMDAFKQGYFTIQDLSAGLAAATLAPKPNEKILDCCSAPGGKTTYLAEIMQNNGEIEAWDIYEHRLKLVEENAKRLGINIIKTKLQDATKFDPSRVRQFDKILLDVPCLGLGVIKRKPDIKWQRKPENINEINDVQLKILNNCSKYLKKNGELVYSTCSILKEENEKVIEKFMKNNKEFKYESEICINTTESRDGFFICKLKRK